jgi:ligand-binding sensor domain-containing protein/serine phosphatase RsbU (regulator of sigma subunit)
LSPEVLTAENELSSQQVTTLSLDHHGYLWAGTNFGLNRYDGYRFRHFFTSTTGNGYPGIQNIIEAICDDEGNLWVLNKAGLNCIDHKTGEIKKYLVSDFDAVYKPQSILRDIFPAEDGSIWILSDRSITQLSPDEVMNTWLIPDELLHKNALPTCVIAGHNGNIWIGTTNGLIIYSSQQKTFREMAGTESSSLMSNNRVNSLFLDKENSVWIGTSNGLSRVDPVDFAVYEYFPSGSRISQPINEIRDIASANSEELVLATSAGIVKFNTLQQQFQHIYLTTEGNITSVATDSSGIVWAGTSKGILKIRESKMLIRNFNARTPELRLSNEHISALLHNQDDQLFVGYTSNNFSVVNTRSFGIKHYNSMDGSAITGFHPFRQQQTLVLSEHDVEVFSGDNGRRTSFTALFPFFNKSLLTNVKINCAYYDGEKSLWLGTSAGLQCVRLDSARHYTRYTLVYQNQQLNLGEVYDIKSDRFGNLWLGSNKGLIYYNPVKGNFNRYTPYDINLLNTEHKAVYTIISDRSGAFWIGTSAGVFRFDATSREFNAITSSSSVMNATVKALNIDHHGNMWIGTESGIFHHIRSTNTFKGYDLKEGLINDSYTSIASDMEGRIFLGGYQGLSIVNLPGVTRQNKGISNVVITSIKYLENNPQNGDLFYQVPDTINLPWSRKPLQVDFAVLDLSRPELNRFRYSLTRVRESEPKWQSLGEKNSLVLDNLSPGKYRLRINGSDSDMAWNSKGTSVMIIIEAPYWRSTIGLMGIILIGLVLLFLFIRFWIRQFFNLSRENQEREMFAKQIMLQKEELTFKNKAITDSINYAKRIQTAMLPPYKLFKSIFPSSFILFMPKDIVSGDFYWVNKVGNRIFISAVDCTGHGVPGAFMSIIGFELFRKITNIEGLTRPSDVLNRLNDDFHEIFKDVDNVVLRDGMDVAFCSIDKKDMILEFAGAFNPLYLIRDNKIMEIKGDRFAIGLDETNFKEQTFKNHIIPIQKGDIIYIFSDGFADQFGGPDGKKYKYRRFRHLLLNLHQLPMEKQHEILENNVLEWRGTQDQVDDILVIGIKVDF